MHVLNDKPVRAISVLQRVDVIAIGTVHDECVHVAALDGKDSILGLSEPTAEVRDFREQVRNLVGGCHGFLGCVPC
jgi:hypothetical protein